MNISRKYLLNFCAHLCLDEAKRKFAFFSLIFISFGFGAYKITESPPTWIDEGMVTQLALNLERYGALGLQTSPGNFVSGAYISVGFPVTLPLAGIFSLTGETLLSARAFMLLWILLLVSFSYFYLLKEFGMRIALAAGLLLVTFAPLYGNGKNVLGEVPGLVLFFIFLFLLYRIEEKKFAGRPYVFLGAGFLLGLAVVTKPIFILALGACLVAYAWSRWNTGKHLASLKYLWFFGAGISLPLIIWIFTQFSVSDSFWDIFSLYRNPYNLENVSSVMLANFLRFFRELSPLYTMLSFFLWSASIFIRERKKTEEISISERIAFVFSLLVLFFYLRTPGWYRYFFPAQIIVLAYLPNSLFSLASYFLRANPALDRGVFNSVARIATDSMVIMQKDRRVFKGGVNQQNIRRAATSLILGLALFQAYQTSFSSWVADHYSSTRTSELAAYFKDWSSKKSVFVYNAPEVVIFLPRDNVYYQFLEVNRGRSIGRAELDQISRERITDAVVLSLDEEDKYPQDLFPGYTVKDIINRYVILEAKK